jgi:NADPH:quinone reductase-like Zn-dependent oxidoreductase
MIPASIAGLFQAMVLGPLISMAGSQKMGTMTWKPFKTEDVAFLTDLIETGKITPVIDRTYPLNEVPEALRYQEEGRARGKIVITM